MLYDLLLPPVDFPYLVDSRTSLKAVYSYQESLSVSGGSVFYSKLFVESFSVSRRSIIYSNLSGDFFICIIIRMSIG